MQRFAFITNASGIRQLKDIHPITRLLPGFILKSCLKRSTSFNILRMHNIRCRQGKQVEGYFIFCPLLSAQMVEFGREFILDKLFFAGHLAKQTGARIIGLGGDFSLVGDKIETISKLLKIPLTSGHSLTAWSVFEAVFKAAKAKNIDLSRSSLAVIGALEHSGVLCLKKFSSLVAKMILQDKDSQKLIYLKEELSSLGHCAIEIEPDPYLAARKADILINATSPYQEMLDMAQIKPKAIFCDIVSGFGAGPVADNGGDFIYISAGLIKLPCPDKIGLNIGLPAGVIPAAMAESAILALENKMVNYSSGAGTNVDKLEEIADLCARGGFEIWSPDYKCEEKKA
jgi:predicted amino acid dehydrogenase